MFSLVESLYQSFFSVPNYNILIAGHENVGKTTFFEQIRYMYDPVLQKEASNSLKQTLSKERDKQKAVMEDASSPQNAASTVDGSNEEQFQGASSFHLMFMNSFANPSLVSPHGTLSTSNDWGEVVVPCAKGIEEYIIPASKALLDSRHISPTVGLNYAKVVHREAAAVAALHASVLFPVTPIQASSVVSSLPPPPANVNTPKGDATVFSPKLKPCTLTLWDVSGQRTLRGLWSNYFNTCQGIIFIVDTTLHLRVTPPFILITKDHIAPLRALYRDYHQTLRHLLSLSELEGVPFLILGNKCDVPGHLTAAQLQDALGLDEIAVEEMFYSSDGRRRGGLDVEPGQPRNEGETAEEAAPRKNEGHYSSDPSTQKGNRRNSSACSRSSARSTASGHRRGSTKKKGRNPASRSSSSIPSMGKSIENGARRSTSTSPHSVVSGNSEEQETQNNTNITMSSFSSLPRATLRRRQSREGFGNKTVKLMCISALTGMSVAFAMDWMVEQLQEDARPVPP